MIKEDYIDVHKDFRKYLRVIDGKHGTVLSSMISSVDTYVPSIIRRYFSPSFDCLYDSTLPFENIVRISILIGKNEEILADKGGYAAYECIRSYIKFYGDRNDLDVDSIYNKIQNELVETPQTFVEGASSDQNGTRYERDPKARQACINYYGCRCYVCGMDFEKTYGQLGKGFIEVHHKIPISQRGGSYIVNPITDLVPLCSNCHSMVHRRADVTMDVDELKRIVDSHKTKE